MAKKYLAWKDANCNGENIEWVTMNGIEFYRFISKPENKSRYFVRLPDFDSDEDYLVIESTKEQYIEWRVEYDRKKYSDKTQPKYEVISLDYKHDGYDGCSLESMIPNNQVSVEEAVISEMYSESVLSVLNEEERALFNKAYPEYIKALTTRELGEIYGVTNVTIHKRLKKIFEKLEIEVNKHI